MTGRDYRIVYLSRENLVRHVLSNLTAQAKGSYHKKDDRQETIRIRVDNEDLRKGLADRQRWLAQEREALDAVPHHRIVYEPDLEIASMHQASVTRSWAFSGGHPRPFPQSCARSMLGLWSKSWRIMPICGNGPPSSGARMIFSALA